MRTLTGIFLILLLGSTPAGGRQIFVDNARGDDRSGGHQAQHTPDQDGPVRTITRALQLAGNGDTIVLAATRVPYHESISLVGNRLSGSLQQPFVIRGNGAVLDGSAPIPPDAWQSYEGAVFRFRPQHTSYQQLYLDGQPAARVAVPPGARRPPPLQPLEWCLLGGDIYFRVEQKKLPADYNLSYAAQPAGITLFHVENVIIMDLTLQHFQLDGISAFNSARYIALADVRCRNNGRSGIAVGGASYVKVDGGVLQDNGYAQLLTFPYSQTHLYRTQLLPETARTWADQGGQIEIDGKPVESTKQREPSP